jgi:hypothetical protein
MKHLILVTLVAVGFCSCAPPPTGGTSPTATSGDSVVVTAEKTLRTAKDTFDLFLHLEYDNRAALEKVSPEIHKYADYIRKNAPDWLITANNLKNTYKHNRTAENKATLATALTTIVEAMSQSQKYITQAAKVGP